MQKELAFQHEFTRLEKELYPNEKPIDMAAALDFLQPDFDAFFIKYKKLVNKTLSFSHYN